MEPLMFIMAILGCGEGEAACREVATVEAHYASEAECMAATESELMRRDDILYPSVVAQCRPANARPQLLRGSDVALPDAPLNRQAPPRFAESRPARDRRR